MSQLPEQKLKVDVVVKYFYPVAAGIETNVMETYAVLAEKGWDVTIHTSKDMYLEKNVLPDSEIIRGLSVKRYPFNMFGYFPNIDWQNTNVVALHNFDIFPHFRIMLYCLWLKWTGRKKFKLFLTPHGGFNPEWAVFTKLQAIIKATYHFTLGSLMINLVMDGVRAVSEWEKEEMLKKFISKKLVRTIPNGIEDEALRDPEAEASEDIKEKVKSYGRYLLQIGRIYPIKNYETTIRALPHIPSDIKFVIAGPVTDQKYREKLEKLAQELGVQERVLFIGVIRGADKFYLIKRAQMMVHMAIWESFCNVVHEGMSQGLVCLVADNTALPYLIKNNINGWCIPTHDSAMLAERINFVLNNSNTDLIKNIKTANKNYAQGHTWRKVAEGMDKFYREHEQA